MRTIKVNQGQNLLDIALQEYGSTEALVDLVFDNNLEIDSVLAGGDELLIDDSKVINADVVRYFIDQGIKVNTGELEAIVEPPPPPPEEDEMIFDNSFDETFE